MTVNIDDIWEAINGITHEEDTKETYKEFLDLLDEKYGLYDDKGNITIDRLTKIKDNTTKNEWLKFLKTYNTIIEGLIRRNGHYGEYIGFYPRELNKMVYSDIDTKYPVKRDTDDSVKRDTDDSSNDSSDGDSKYSVEEEISGSVKRPKWNIPLNPIESFQDENVNGNEEEDMGESVNGNEEESIGESVNGDTGENTIVPVEDQMKIVNSIGSILKDIHEKPLEETISDLSMVIPLVTDPELSDRLESYTIDKLSSMVDTQGNPLFRDTGEIMNFIQLLRNRNNKRYKLPVRVDREIRREGIVNMKPSVLISRVQYHGSHLKSQRNNNIDF